MKWRLMEIHPGRVIWEYGLLEVLWGTDIFIGRVPFLKCVLLGNILFMAAFVMLARRKHGR